MQAQTGSQQPLLSVEDVSVSFRGQPVLKNVSFEVAPGQLIGMLGPNGAGKSTLLNVIAGLLKPESGRILIYGQPPAAALRSLAYVPQQERINWRFPATTEELVLMGRCSSIGWLRRPGSEDRRIVRACIDRLGLSHLSNALVSTLSGGERQRAFIARALAQEASLLLLDEAFSGVDVGSQERLVEILLDLRSEGKTILLVTHDLTGLARRFDACLCLNCHVCAYGPPSTTLTMAVLEELYGSHLGLLAAND